jgi:AcrR family transcriptional regulator
MVLKIVSMQKQRSSENARGVLDPTIPVDIGAQSQRRRIVDAMLDSCAEKTYAATTISDIVSRASISRTTFYKRFAGKRDCFDAAVEHCIDMLRAAASESHCSADSPPQAVRRATAATLEQMAARPAVAQLLVSEAISVEPAIVERLREFLISDLEGLWQRSGAPLRLHSDPNLALGRVQVLLFDQIARGDSEELPALLPEIVYLVLLPFAGHEEALGQSQLAGGPAGDGTHTQR